ncbi:MAG: hypothetical protein ACR2NU_03745 [Aeoliella sp.]
MFVNAMPFAPALAEPINIGTVKQVFIDGRFVKSSHNVELVVNRPRVTGEALLVAEHPWESGWIGGYHSVLQERGRIHMWYDASDGKAVTDPANGMTGVAYAHSDDGGATWVKPHLGVVEYDGSRKNNLVIKGVHGIHVFRNRPGAPPAEKYLLFSGQPNKLFVSGDGIHWNPKGAEPFLNMAGNSGLDSQNVMFWDTRTKKYVAYPRINLAGFNRTVGRTESEMLGSFPDPVVVLQRDKTDSREMDFYTSATIQYPFAADAYFMFPAAYHHWPSPPHPGNDGPLDIQFAASRDGVKWLRPDRRPIIRLGTVGSWDGGCMYAGYGLTRHRNDLSLYFSAYDVTHGNYVKRGYIGGTITRAIYRLDGFMSVDAGYKAGQFTTSLIRFTGNRLEQNMAASAGGWITVELLDQNDQPVPGFTRTDADKMLRNSIAAAATWHGKSELSSLKGKPVKLRFLMRDAKLFAFQAVQ